MKTGTGVKTGGGSARRGRSAAAAAPLQPRDGGLAHQVEAGLGQTAAGELECRIGAEVVEVVGILIPAGNRQDTRQQDLGERVHDPTRVTPVGDHRGELVGNAQSTGGLSQKQDAAIRGQASAVEGGCELLALHGWKREWERRRIGHGGRGGLDQVKEVGVSTQSLSHINALRYARHRKSTALVNKTG